MKQLSKIPESLIWMVFSVTAGFGYAFSVFDYIGVNAKLSAADVVIPTYKRAKYLKKCSLDEIRLLFFIFLAYIDGNIYSSRSP